MLCSIAERITLNRRKAMNMLDLLGKIRDSSTSLGFDETNIAESSTFVEQILHLAILLSIIFGILVVGWYAERQK